MESVLSGAILESKSTNPPWNASIKEFTMLTRVRPALCIAAAFLFAIPLFAQNHKIDFEDFAGPSRFAAVQAPVHSLSATISGGQVLRNATPGPLARAAVYG